MLVITCWLRADLLALAHKMVSCVFVTFPSGVVFDCYTVSIPDLCFLLYLGQMKISVFWVTGLKILGRVGTHIFYYFLFEKTNKQYNAL